MRRAKNRLVVLVLAFCVASTVVASTAFAMEGAWWHLSATMAPTYVPPGGEATLVLRATNRGDVGIASEKVPITITDQLPAGLVAVGPMSATTGMDLGTREDGNGEPVCEALSCTLSDPRTLQPFEGFEAQVRVKAQAGATSGQNVVSIHGGESRRCLPVGGGGGFMNIACSAKHEGISETHTGNYEGVPTGPVAPVSSTSTLIVKEGPVPFGLTEYGLAFESEDGSPDKQAGSHPFQFSTSLAFNENETAFDTPGTPKDLHINLPPGLIGNATTMPQCDEADFSHLLPFAENVNTCPADSAVGVAEVTVAFRLGNVPWQYGEPITFAVPLFNLVPAPGEPARFGFEAEASPVTIDIGVRTGRDYGIVANVTNITQQVSYLSSNVTLWGVPGDSRHDSARGWACINADKFEYEAGKACAPERQEKPAPFLTMPSSCTGELQTSVQTDAWDGTIGAAPLYQVPLPGMTGCSKLPFDASIGIAPDVQEASKPTGLNVRVHVPQEANNNAEGLAGADVKDMTVTLPQGVTINPAGADGLEACSDGQVGYEPAISEPPGKLDFTGSLPEPLNPGMFLGSEGFCPNASKIGTVKISIPVIAHPLIGSVYLAAQDANPFGSLVAMYIVAEDSVSGVLVKLAGEVKLDPTTGQIVATFENTPQAPFEDAELHFFGGDRAPLSTPSLCGTYTTQASITPWNGNPPVNTSSSFQIKTGPNGTPCPNAPGDQSPTTLPFKPSLTAGTTSNQAGGFSPFTMTMSREDGNQDLQAISLHMPPGLSGLLSSVSLCGEAQADAGTCPSSSEIGETTVSVGLGGDPYSVKGGKVFITGAYEGAPYGLSIVNPANAGPFHLGNVIVRAKIEVDPITAALTITSDNTGPYKIPTMLDGIPLQIKHVNVTIGRPGFTFNPTNCDRMSITGSLNSTAGAVSNLSVPLQVTNCAVLGFKPAFSVSTNGKTSRANGASLHVKLVYPKAPFGSQANIRSVKVNLPKQLPSRLTTLQKACPDSTFNANPAACPPESRIGEAKATTPLLPVPLAGPVYFVSHGGAKFPELVIVLSGYGTTVQLRAETFISPAGITSSTFRTVPDLPVGTFELTLPQGKFSALAANGNLCKSKLAMPTAFTAQNGAQIKQSTPISVTGCKPSIAVMSQSVKGNTATIVANVPSAGRLVASGAEIKRSVKRVGKAGTVTIGVTLTSHGLRVLAKNPHQRVNANVKLRFTPEHGAPLTAFVRLLLG
jgi:hypothetical protein